MRNEENTNGKGKPLIAALVRMLTGVAFIFGLILMCLSQEDDGPIRWVPLIATKIGGIAALVASSAAFTWSERKWGPADPDDDDNC